MVDWSSGLDVYVSRKAQIVKQPLTFIPRQAEGSNIGHAQASHGVAHRCRFKFAIHHLLLGPIDQLVERHLVTQICFKLIGDKLAGNSHNNILRSPMALIDRILLVNLHERAGFIVDFLPESNRILIGVHFLHVAGSPIVVSDHVQPIAPTATS